MSELRKEYGQHLAWKDYPIGTKVFAINGGFWTKTNRGYKWCSGSTFPTPGGDWNYIVRPETTNIH